MQVTKVQAIMLRDLGYNLKCRDYYNDRDGQLKTFVYRNYNDGHMTYSAPSIDEVVRWLREVWSWHISAEPIWCNKMFWAADVVAIRTMTLLTSDTFDGDSHDEAVSKAITDTLKHIITQRKNKTHA